MNNEIRKHRLLIISNNVLSKTRSNGKTILSYFDILPFENVRQLYFSKELPSIPGYNYFQISDTDIIKGIFNQDKRGMKVIPKEKKPIVYKQTPNTIKKPFYRLLREILWKNHWLSERLINWLDEYNPTDIFFVAGDSIFAYDICKYIRNKYNSRLSLYLTDDYILPRKNESIVAKYRRKLIKNKLKNLLDLTNSFFTISTLMSECYKEIFGKDSFLAVNMTESLKVENIQNHNDFYYFIYAGSLYYGRDEVLGSLAKTLQLYNASALKKAKLKIFTNSPPTKRNLDNILVDQVSEYAGNLNEKQLKLELNKADILVIAESFDDNQIENTRLSLSTKATEYMSVGKPILAIGPNNIGTINYLSDVACCVNTPEIMLSKICELLLTEQLQKNLSSASIEKYNKNHKKEVVQKQLIKEVFGLN